MRILKNIITWIISLFSKNKRGVRIKKVKKTEKTKLLKRKALNVEIQKAWLKAHGYTVSRRLMLILIILIS